MVLASFSFKGYAQQAVTGIITDYNGFWKSRVGSINAVKPVNSHNLLSFTYNNTQYSTGIDDILLSNRGETFVPGDFWALPVDGYSGTITSNTKIGVGEMYDGVHNGAGPARPDRIMTSYLTDGIKGLDIGTCVANLPVGTLVFSVSNIRPENIGDGIPDILVTQVADPSNSTDKYAFTNAAGQVVGVSKDIVFNNIAPVANWTADFYEGSISLPRLLTSSFTNTDRPIRLWAADLSDFGITQANYQQILKFRITLSGNSDVAFVAYNNKTFSINTILPVKLDFFNGQVTDGQARLHWQTQSELNASHFIVEKSRDSRDFIPVDSIPANGSSVSQKNYSSIDRTLEAGYTYYRLQMVDKDGRIEYSRQIRLQYRDKAIKLTTYPNPATDRLLVSHPGAGKSLEIYNTAGLLIRRVALNTGATQSTLDVTGLGKGLYYIVWQDESEKLSRSFLVR